MEELGYVDLNIIRRELKKYRGRSSSAKSSRKVSEYFQRVHVRKSKTPIVHSDKSLESSLQSVDNAYKDVPLRADTERKPMSPVTESHSSESIQLTSFSDAILLTSTTESTLLDTTGCL